MAFTTDVPAVVLFTTVISQNGFLENNQEIIPHMVLASPRFGCYILMRHAKYISVFVTFPDRQLLQLP